MDKCTVACIFDSRCRIVSSDIDPEILKLLLSLLQRDIFYRFDELEATQYIAVYLGDSDAPNFNTAYDE